MVLSRSCAPLSILSSFCVSYIFEEVEEDEDESIAIKLTMNGFVVYPPFLHAVALQPTSILVITSYKAQSHMRYQI